MTLVGAFLATSYGYWLPLTAHGLTYGLVITAIAVGATVGRAA